MVFDRFIVPIFIFLFDFMKAILGKKIGMTTIYDEKKGALNVTLIECVPNLVTIVRNIEKDGYSAVQLESELSKKSKVRREFRIKNEQEKEQLKKGTEISVEVFKEGDKVSVSGITKAKGFQGVMKRHGFKGAPKSHGHKHDWRAPGSIGSSFPERVFKGKRMAGRMGGDRFTVKNLKVALVDKENKILAVVGAVPGVAGRIVEVRG